MNLNHVTKFPPYFPFTLCCFYTKISSLMPVSTIGIVRDCFYLFIFYFEKFSAWVWLLGNLRSNNADDNENVKKTIGLISKTTTSHVHHTFLYISFPFLHDYDLKMPHFAFHRGRKQATTKFYFSASELEYGFLKFSSRRVRLHLTK